MYIFDNDPTVNWLNDWLRNYGIWISIAAAGAVFLVVLVLFIVAMIKRRQNPIPYSAKSVAAVETSAILEALGGRDNIIAHSLTGSRIVLVLKDYSIVKDEVLNQNGIESIIKMSNKITLVSKSESGKIYKGLFH